MNIIKRLFLGLLNFFPNRVKEGSNGRLTGIVVSVIVAVCLCIGVKMASNIEPKFAFFIDSFQLPSSETLAVGDGSDVCFRGVPKDFLVITPREDGSFDWRVNDDCRDSLMYFKVNDINPQKHEIRDDEGQTVTILLSADGTDSLTLTGKEIWDEWDDFSKQKDVLARHFAARYGVMHRCVSDSDSLRWENYCNCRGIRSFFEKNDGGISLVILDDRTFISDGGVTVGYVREGSTASVDDNGQRSVSAEQRGLCKIQFFNVSSYCYMDGEGNNGTFQIDGVNYAMKPTVLLTEWGAGHVMIENDGSGCFSVRYPKALGYVGTIDSLYDYCSGTSHMFTFRQRGCAFPAGTDIYLPQLSAAITQDICTVVMKGGYDICLRDNENDSLQVVRARTGLLPFMVVPSLDRYVLCSGGNRILCRAGFVDSGFALSYLAVPFFVGIVLILLVLLPFSPVRVDTDNYSSGLYCSAQLRRYPVYLSILIFIAMAYCFCKSLIALKLSYTFPYFEKLTAITPATTALFLLVFFTLAMIFNGSLIGVMEGDKDDVFANEDSRHGGRKWIAWIVVAALFGVVGYVFFGLLDSLVSLDVIRSYFHSQIFSLNVFAWRNIHGINDTHRSVPYALFFVEAVLLAVWFVVNCYYQFAFIKRPVDGVIAYFGGKWEMMSAWCDEKKNELTDYVRGRVGNKCKIPFLRPVMDYKRRHFDACLIVLVVLMLLAFFISSLSEFLIFLTAVWAVFCLWDAIALALKVLFPGHAILLVVLAFAGPLLGNFGTAFISVAVIVGLCRALSSVGFTDDYRQAGVERRHVAFFQMFVISFVYICAAMCADNGYMTNYMGFIMAVICFYFIIDKSGRWTMFTEEAERKENRWVLVLMAFAVAIFMLLPTLCSRMFDTDDVHYSRFSQRIMLYSNFDDLQKSGYRYAESDAEFMTIMSHYMQRSEGDDPLSNEDHFLHSSVSTGQSPVVLNDLSVPVAFIGSYGIVKATSVYFLLLLALMLLVAQFSLSYEADGFDSYLTRAMQWRLLAMFMWIGTSFYIYMSYIGRVPFTGRLNPGFGVDAVGEALESAILLAFMAVVTVRCAQRNDIIERI